MVYPVAEPSWIQRLFERHEHKTGSRRVVATRSGNRSDDPWRPKRRLGIGAGWSLDPLAIILVRLLSNSRSPLSWRFTRISGRKCPQVGHEGAIQRPADLREVQADPPQGRLRVICEDPRHKQRQGLREQSMPRIQGVDIPPDKPTHISLRYIYGIGPTTSLRGVREARTSTRSGGPRSLTDDEIARIAALLDREYLGRRGRCAGRRRRTSPG